MAALVSVYIPTKDRPALLMRAVNSVKGQTYRDIEIVICDDGSSERNFELICERYGGDTQCQIIRNSNSVGACVARNQAITRSSGDFVTGLDDDDCFLPNRVEWLLKAAKETGTFVCSNYVERFERVGRTRDLVLAKSGRLTIADLMERNVVGNQVLAPREMFFAAGLFDGRQACWQDYDLWVRMAKVAGSGYKTEDRSYVISVDHARARISTRSETARGILSFIDKNRELLSEEQVFGHLISYYERSQVDGWWKLILRSRRYGKTTKAVAAYLRSKHPQFAESLMR